MNQENNTTGGKQPPKQPPRTGSAPTGQRSAAGGTQRPAGQRAASQGQKRPAAQARSGTKGGGQKKSGPPKRTGKAQVLHVLYIILTVISAVIVAGYLLWKILVPPPTVDKPNRPAPTRPPITTQMVDENTGQIVEVEIPALSEDRKEQFYTFLLIGVSQDTGGGLTDTMMLAAYDVPNQKLSIMSLPRDIYVNYSGTRLLNSVYVVSGGDKDGKGVEGLKKAVQNLTGIYPDFHAVVQWEALGEMVDAIGGVDFEVPFDMYYNDLSQHFKINLKKGWQTLDGEGAMGLIRWRHNSDDKGNISKTYGYREGDIGRIKTQQDFLKAVIKKCLQPDVLLPNLMEYIGIFQKNVDTNLTVGELAYFGQSAVTGLNMEDLSLVILPYQEAGNGHLLPVGSQIVKTVNSSFNPYMEDIRQGELKLATMADVPKTSAEPEESEPAEDPDATGEPEDPDSSHRPGEEEDPNGAILPPGVVPSPSQSAAPGGLVRPAGSPAPSASPKPTPSGTPGPAHSGEPRETPKPAHSAQPESPSTQTPGGSISTPAPSTGPAHSDPPAETPAPTPPPAPTTVTPPPDEEPLLPPGI